MSGRERLLGIYRVALESVRGGPAAARALRALPPLEPPFSVLAVGKAACAMAEGAREVLGERVLGGRICTPDGHARRVEGMVVREAGHPVPDARSEREAREALALADGLGRGDTLLVLISGGTSALWCAPAEGIGLEAKRRLTECLLRSGVDIEGLNAVRKHVSQIKGGGLARRAYPARVVTLALSDVRGDGIETIGSGPTAADPSTFADALAVLRRAEVLEAVPASVRLWLEEGAAGRHPETLKPGDEALLRVGHRVVATLDDALRAAVAAGERSGWRVWSLGACLYGEAREEGARLAARLDEARRRGIDLIVAGGEPTVKVRGAGRGGRAQEMALAFALAVEGREVEALFAGTDGADGPTDAAGAVVDGSTVGKSRAEGLDARLHLDRNDAHPLLERTGSLIRTGPTDTNVTDIVLIHLG